MGANVDASNILHSHIPSEGEVPTLSARHHSWVMDENEHEMPGAAGEHFAEAEFQTKLGFLKESGKIVVGFCQVFGSIGSM